MIQIERFTQVSAHAVERCARYRVECDIQCRETGAPDLAGGTLYDGEKLVASWSLYGDAFSFNAFQWQNVAEMIETINLFAVEAQRYTVDTITTAAVEAMAEGQE